MGTTGNHIDPHSGKDTSYRIYIPNWAKHVEKTSESDHTVSKSTETSVLAATKTDIDPNTLKKTIVTDETSVDDIDPKNIVPYIPDYAKVSRKRLRKLERKAKLGKLSKEEEKEWADHEKDERGILKKSFHGGEEKPQVCQEVSSNDGVTYVKKHCCCRKYH